jgi:hypothetical protein
MSNKNALVGHTGFVGGFLAARLPFTHAYRRSDIEDIRGQSFDLLICAGLPAAKWLANQHPEEDTRNTDRLIAALADVQTERFVLLSTVDIYQDSESCNETTLPRPMHPYGLNRLRLECFVRNTFPAHHILRLPALFGEGLKKNALYDLLHDNQIDKINPASEFQWYDLEWLPRDIELCVRNEISEANLFSEPVAMETIRQHMFPDSTLNPSAPLVRYDHRTILPILHRAARGTTGYRATAAEVLHAMRGYVAMARGM